MHSHQVGPKAEKTNAARGPLAGQAKVVENVFLGDG